jgi:hypothetical protein
MPSFPSILTQSEPRVWIITITKPVILPKWIQVCINQLLNPFTTFSDEKQQKFRRNKQIFRQNISKYIVFTHIGRACERHRGYGSNSLWIDQSGSFFNPVWPEPLNDGSGYEIVKNDVYPFSYPEPFLRAVNRARRGALAKSISNWLLIGHNEIYGLL